MTTDEYEALKQSIKDIGQQQPIIIYDNEILDGFHRYQACEELNITPKTEVYEGDNPVQYVLSANFSRRHLTQQQRAMIGAKLSEDSDWGGNKKSKVQDCTLTIKEASVITGVSPRTIKVARKLMSEASPQIVDLVSSNDISIYDGLDISKKPEDIQENIIDAKLSGNNKHYKELLSNKSDQRICISCQEPSTEFRQVCENCFNEVDKR